MLYEFLVYPHEVCYRPQITMASCYQGGTWISEVIDNYSFTDKVSFPPDVKASKDSFDDLCVNDDFAKFVKSELNEICHLIVDSLGFGHYYFNLHNKDADIKPHFHLVFEIPRGCTFYIPKIFESLGIYTWVRSDFEKRGKKYQRLERKFPTVSSDVGFSRLLEYDDYMRSNRLRYLCHLDNLDKFQYSLTDVVSDVNYCDDLDVLNPQGVTAFATFLGLKQRYKLNDEVDWFEWFASARLNDDTRSALNKIKTDIHRYYVAFYYRLNKKERSYT